MAQYSKRGRNSNRRRQGGNNNPNRSMDSQGPEVKIRGTATQIYDKYQALARDAASAGDRIRAESLMQHAEHYYRLMKSMQPAEKPVEKKSEDSAPAADQQDASAETPTEESAEAAPTEEKKPDSEAAPAEPTAEGETEAEAEAEPKPRRRRRRRRAGEDEPAAADSSADRAPAVEEVAPVE